MDLRRWRWVLRLHRCGWCSEWLSWPQRLEFTRQSSSCVIPRRFSWLRRRESACPRWKFQMWWRFPVANSSINLSWGKWLTFRTINEPWMTMSAPTLLLGISLDPSLLTITITMTMIFMFSWQLSGQWNLKISWSQQVSYRNFNTLMSSANNFSIFWLFFNWIL